MITEMNEIVLIFVLSCTTISEVVNFLNSWKLRLQIF